MILQRENPLRKGFRLFLVLGVFEMELDEGGDFSFEDIFIDRAKEVVDGARQVTSLDLHGKSVVGRYENDGRVPGSARGTIVCGLSPIRFARWAAGQEYSRLVVHSDAHGLGGCQ